MVLSRPLFNALSGLMLIASTSAISQGIELAGFSFTRFPAAEVRDSPLNREIEVNEYNFFLNIPKKLKNEKTILLNGLQYKLVTPSADNDAALNIDGQNLHLIGYRLSVFHQLKNDWSTLVMINPALSSTFNQPLQRDDFLFNGTAMLVKQKSERFSYGVGLVATSRFGDPLLLPALRFSWKSEKSRLEMLLPRSITYERYFGKLTAGLQVGVDGSLYNVNYDRTSILDDIEPVDKLSYTRVIFGLQLSYRIAKMIKLEASGGFTLTQRLQLQGDSFEDENYDLENSPFFQVGIALVPPKNGDK